MSEEIKRIIYGVITDFVEEKQVEITDETPLYGKDGLLTSILLVRFINDLEDEVNEKYDTALSLMSEKAFSRSRSPFRSIKDLSEFVFEELKVAGGIKE